MSEIHFKRTTRRCQAAHVAGIALALACAPLAPMLTVALLLAQLPALGVTVLALLRADLRDHHDEAEVRTLLGSVDWDSLEWER